MDKKQNHVVMTVGVYSEANVHAIVGGIVGAVMQLQDVTCFECYEPIIANGKDFVTGEEVDDE